MNGRLSPATGYACGPFHRVDQMQDAVSGMIGKITQPSAAASSGRLAAPPPSAQISKSYPPRSCRRSVPQNGCRHLPERGLRILSAPPLSHAGPVSLARSSDAIQKPEQSGPRTFAALSVQKSKPFLFSPRLSERVPQLDPIRPRILALQGDLSGHEVIPVAVVLVGQI